MAFNPTITNVTASGYTPDNSPIVSSPVYIAGQAVTPSTYTPGYSTGDVAALAVDAANGALLVEQGNLVAANDSVQTYGYDGTTYQKVWVTTASASKYTSSNVVLVQPIDPNGNSISKVTYFITSSFNRPSNTTTYASGDVVSNATSNASTNIISSSARFLGGSGLIVNASLCEANNPVTSGSYEVWIFRTCRTSENDNFPFTGSITDISNNVGIIPFQTSYVATSGSGGAIIYRSPTLSLPFVCSPNTSSLYWNLIVRNSYTPISGEQYILTLNIIPD